MIVANRNLLRVAMVVQDPSQGDFLNAADRLAVLKHRQLREARRIQDLDRVGNRRLGVTRHQLAAASLPQQVADRLGWLLLRSVSLLSPSHWSS